MKKSICAILIAFLSVVWLGCEQQMDAYRDGTMKAKWMEAQMNLPMIVTAQIGYKAFNKRYGTTFKEIGYSVIEENQRYSYFLGKDVLKGHLGPDKLPKYLSDAMPTDDSFVVYAVANLDNDPDLDIWKIDQNRKLQHIRNDQ